MSNEVSEKLMEILTSVSDLRSKVSYLTEMNSIPGELRGMLLDADDALLLMEYTLIMHVGPTE